MTEQEIIDAGFEREDVTHEESQNGYDYYYYKKKIGDEVVLISSDNDESGLDNWYVKNFDWPCVKITNIKDVRILEELMAKWHA
jgi:hypothetical protein